MADLKPDVDLGQRTRRIIEDVSEALRAKEIDQRDSKERQVKVRDKLRDFVEISVAACR